MAQENKPKLFNYNENQYSFNELSQRLDAGFSEYVSTLNLKDEDINKIYNAYSNLMSGIEDGTVVYKNGRFSDSRGRYSNGIWYDDKGNKQTSKGKNKDYYGLVANYIASGIKRLNKYEEPKDTSKREWRDTSMSEALLKGIFNSTTYNPNYFINQDTYDDKTQSRGTSVRSKLISDWIDKNINNDFFNNYDISDEEKLRQIQLAQEASNKLKENGFTSNDLLYLSRAFPEISWDNLFAADLIYDKKDSQDSSQDSEQNFETYMNTNYPKKDNSDGQFTITYNQKLPKSVFDAVKQMNEKQMLNYLVATFDNQSSDFRNNSAFRSLNTSVPSSALATLLLSKMKSQGRLVQDSQNQDIYYIPELFDKNTNSGYYFDSKTNTLYKKHVQDIPYWTQQIRNKWSQLFTQYKNGGIIKAQTGVKFNDNANWYTGVFIPSFDYILEGLKKNKQYADYLNNMQERHAKIYRAAGVDFQNKAYVSDDVKAYQDDYKLGYNGEFGDNKAGYNSFGIAKNLNMFDLSGPKRTSGDWSDGNWTSDGMFSAITDFRRLLGREGDFTPEQLAEVTKKFADAGWEFKLGEDKYYRVSPIISTPKVDNQNESKDTKNDNPSEDTGSSTDTIPTTPQSQDEWTSNILRRLVPESIAAGRLFYSIRTNNKIADILKNSLNPVLKNTYERYSPITGAFSEMQFRNRQAAALRRQTSRPFTPDASLYLAGWLDADRQARDLEYQGFLADDREIRRTREAALARQEDNMLRRSDIANFNRASINQTNRERAQLEATRLKQNWTSGNSYLQELESRLRTRLAEKEARDYNNSMQLAQSRYQDAINSLDRDYSGMTTSQRLSNKNYLGKIKELRNRYQYELYNIGKGNYLKNPTPPRTYQSILLSRNGGKIKSMISKIIKNENNT